MTPCNRKNYRLFHTLVLILVAAVFGLLLHYRSQVRRLSPEFKKLYQVVRLIEKYYVEETDLVRVTESGLHGMLRELTPAGFVVNDDSSAPGDIGLVLYPRNGSPMVITTIPGSPADLAPIQTGDLLLEIDGKPIYHEPFAHIQTRLPGEIDSRIRLEFFSARFEKNYSVTLKRNAIRQKPVLANFMPDARTGYLRLGEITDTAAAALAESLAELNIKNIQRLLLDLRQTSRGTLSGTIGVLSLFLPPKQLVLQTIGPNQTSPQKFFTRHAGKNFDLPLVVLINHGTSLWAEAVAGSLQDLNRAVIAGENSFGLADIYGTISLKDRTRIRLATARFMTASGRCLGRKIDSTSFWQELKVVATDSVRLRRGEFKTRDGRLIYAGEGITPDESVSPDLVTNLELCALLPEFLADQSPATTEIQLVQRFKNFIKEQSPRFSAEAWKTHEAEIVKRIRFTRTQAQVGLEQAIIKNAGHDTLLQQVLAGFDKFINQKKEKVFSENKPPKNGGFQPE